MEEARRNGMKMVVAGMATAIATLSMPVGFIETVLASSGISEALPAAAPPIGLKGQGLIAAFSALMAMGMAGMMGRDSQVAGPMDDEEGRDGRARGARKMGFAFSKLTALARGRATPVEEPDAPVLRRADAHPDAPARAPIFASRDFDGLEIFAKADPARSETGRPDMTRRPVVVASDGVAQMPSATPRFASVDPVRVADPATVAPAFVRPTLPVSMPVEPDSVEPAASHPAEAPMELAAEPIDALAEVEVEDLISFPLNEPTPAPLPLPRPLPTAGLSVTQLTDRLERGLAARRRTMAAAPARVLADMPVSPAVPVRDSVNPDADEALRAALGALRTMAVRGR